ncbi:hypothetical protein [Schlesneria paludicola]|uniref:hypothetical protein n=1 Tax=Schlesneria paludicola TaxID=360056 RepID=UPI0012FAEC91|nr:hypothetical protein [Schlesneria paludicola]
MRTRDVFNIPLGNNNAVTVASGIRSIACRFGWSGDNPWEECEWSAWDTARLNDEERTSEDLFERPLPTGEGDIVDWYLIGCGLGIGKSSSMDPYHRRCFYFIAPYSLIVIPITLLSACLLFTRKVERETGLPHPFLMPGEQIEVIA